MAHPDAHLLTATGAYDKGAIMRKAAVLAKQSLGLRLPGFAKQTYAQAFADNLKLVWARAKAARAATPESIARAAAKADALFAASMIDDTPRFLAVSRAIEARHAQEASHHG